MESPLRGSLLRQTGESGVKQEGSNPANARETRVTEATRVPMSVPSLKLQVPEIPGYHTHWIADRNLARALRAGYTHVKDDEVEVNNQAVADDPSVSGNTDLGSNISVLAGGVSQETRQSQRLYLMKLPQEWWQKDQAARDEVNEGVARTMRAGMTGAENDPEKAMRYLKEGQEMFIPRRLRRR